MKIFLFVFAFLFFVEGYSQPTEDKTPITLDTTSLGFGFGVDYGGTGGSILFYPLRNLGLFGGVGYTPAGIGYNGGIKFRIATKKHSSRLVPFLTAMYGTNAAVVIENGEKYNKLFNGPTFGFGTDLKRKPTKHSFFTLAILFPIYDSNAIDEYIRQIRTLHSLQLKKSLEDVLFSVGFRFILK